MNLSNLMALVQGKKREFVMDFHALVRLVADNKAPEPELIARALQDAGKTVDDLQKAVVLLQRRRQWQQAIAQAETLEAERAGIHKQIAAANRELDLAQERHDEIVWPLDNKLHQIAQAVSEADGARRQLCDTCVNPELLDAMADMQSERGALAAQRQQLSLDHDELKRRGQADLEEAAHARSAADAQALEKRGQSYLARAKQYEPELARLGKKLAKLEQREQEVRQKMLEP